jgi:hypothetical protein
MRWPEGEYWRKPASLDLVKNTPVNCLIVPWGSVADRNGAWKPMFGAGCEAGLSFAGWLGAGSEPGQAIAQAAASRLSALAMPNPPDAQLLPLIPVAERSKLPWQARCPIVATGEGVWPSVRAGRSGDESADAGPTGLPWIDSNAWFARLARALAPEKTLWFAIEPSKQPAVGNANPYLLALADAQASGARWLVSLDATLSDGLASGNAQSQAAWRRIANGLGFFERHKEWRAFLPAGVLAVVSDFAGDNEFLAGEALNLLGRRQLPYRILPKAVSHPLEGFKAILYPDRQPPEGGLRDRMLGFLQTGGLLIGQPALQIFAAGGWLTDSASPRFQVSVLGKGRVAVAKDEVSDPWLLAADTHLLLSRRHDLFRIWNSGAISTDYRISRDNQKAVLQIVNYSGGPASFLSVRFERPFSRGRLWTLEGNAPHEVPMVAGHNWTEFHIPSFFVYAALELEAPA